jgi:hypoxanthine phosphoribosyltransferase
MGRNILHAMQSNLFSVCRRFRFLDMNDVDGLVGRLAHCTEDYEPDLIVGISSGGDFPAGELGSRLRIPCTSMQVSHYSLKILGLELDEIVGMYMLAKALGHKHQTTIIKPADPAEISGRKVLMVDDDSYSGETMKLAKMSLKSSRPASIKAAVLHTYEGNDVVDYAGEWHGKKEFYSARMRFPWSKISPFYSRFTSKI